MRSVVDQAGIPLKRLRVRKKNPRYKTRDPAERNAMIIEAARDYLYIQGIDLSDKEFKCYVDHNVAFD